MQAAEGIGARPGSSVASTGYRALWIILAMLGLVGCAGIGSKPTAPLYDSHQTQDLLTALYDANRGLDSAKWLGKVSMTIDGARRTFDRAFWAGAEPGRVRFDARTPFGLPIMTLACDEAYVTAFSHGDQQYYRRRVGANSLGRLLPVDISCQDFYRLLTGRPPVVIYHTARLAKTAEREQTIELKRRLKGTVARLVVDAAHGALSGFELLDVHGNRLYWASLAKRRTVDGFSLPYRLQLENERGKLELEIARLYPNQPVKASLFQIPPPD